MAASSTADGQGSDGPEAGGRGADARRLRLLWLTERYPPQGGGMAQSCDRIVRGLRAAGTTVDVAHLARRARRPVRVPHVGGRYLAVPAAGDGAHAVQRLWNLVTAPPDDPSAPPFGTARYTHVVAFGGEGPLLAGPAFAAWLGAPLVTLLRGNDFDAGLFAPKRRALLRDALDHAAQVAVVCQAHARKIAALFPRCQPVWIPNGIDLDRWQLATSDRARASRWRRTVVAPGRRVVGLFGHLKPKKGTHLLLHTLLASGLAGRFHLLFVGDVPPGLVETLEGHALDLQYSLHPFGDRYDLLRHYAACDLVALPSHYDGLPNVVLEAAALGLPCLASTAGGLPDVLTDGTHGVLFHPGDRLGLADALYRLATASDDALHALGAAAADRVRGAFTHTQETERYLRLFTARPSPAPAGASPLPIALPDLSS